jgi:hypothetical protein
MSGCNLGTSEGDGGTGMTPPAPPIHNTKINFSYYALQTISFQQVLSGKQKKNQLWNEQHQKGM